MRIHWLLLLLPAVGFCQTADSYSLSVGSKLLLSLVTPITTASAKPGDAVDLVTDFPVTQRNRMVIPVGSTVLARVTAATPSKVRSRAELQLKFESLTLPNGVSKPLNATVIDVSLESTAVKGGEGTLHSTKGKPVPHCLGGLLCMVTSRKYPNLELPAHSALEISLDKAIEFSSDELRGR